MKRLTILAALLLAGIVLMLSGCHQRPDGNQAQASELDQGVAVYRDYGTGCQYVSADSDHSALTPRIAADGKTHMGCKGAQP